MFQQLLLAVDDSPASQVAVSFASALARPAATAVHVLYVNEFLVGGKGLTLHTEVEAIELVRAAVCELQAVGVAASGSVCVATYRQVADRIVASAKDHEADAIVLGSSRRRRLGRLFSRQLRERATRLTSLPIITAPPPLTVTRGRFEPLDLLGQTNNDEQVRSN